VLGCYTSDHDAKTGWISFFHSGQFGETFSHPNTRVESSCATAFNASGEVVGFFTPPGTAVPQAFMRTRDRSWVEIVYPGTNRSWIGAIDATGTAVGYWQDKTGRFHGLVYRRRLCHTLDPPIGPSGHKNSMLTGINNRGQIVGFAFGEKMGPGDGFRISGITSEWFKSNPGVACAVSAGKSASRVRAVK
jgi:hypothetical protein